MGKGGLAMTQFIGNLGKHTPVSVTKDAKEGTGGTRVHSCRVEYVKYPRCPYFPTMWVSYKILAAIFFTLG